MDIAKLEFHILILEEEEKHKHLRPLQMSPDLLCIWSSLIFSLELKQQSSSLAGKLGVLQQQEEQGGVWCPSVLLTDGTSHTFLCILHTLKLNTLNCTFHAVLICLDNIEDKVPTNTKDIYEVDIFQRFKVLTLQIVHWTLHQVFLLTGGNHTWYNHHQVHIGFSWF